jgi:hypothetical protein
MTDTANPTFQSVTLTTTGTVIYGAVDGIVAGAGGGQSNAVPLVALLNRVVTVATAFDSVKLPPSVAGLCVTVTNAAAVNTVGVFATGNDVINALTVNQGFGGPPAGRTCEFICYTAGQWHTLLGA